MTLEDIAIRSRRGECICDSVYLAGRDGPTDADDAFRNLWRDAYDALVALGAEFPEEDEECPF